MAERLSTGRTVSGVTAFLAVAAVLLVGCRSGEPAGAPAVTSRSAPTVPAEGCTTTTGPVTHRYAELPGVDPNLSSLDVYPLPSGCAPSPVVFWVHGGGWRVGDKASAGTDTKAAWAAAHGWTLVAVNYRLSTDGAGVTWPTHGRDVAAAIAWTLGHAGELGVDRNRVALVGHSAGVHITAMVTVDPDLLGAVGLDRTDVDCLVALDGGAFDLRRDPPPGGEVTGQMYADAFGTDPAARAAASPLVVLGQAGGPVADAVVVTRGSPPRRELAQAFAAALRSSGSEVEVVVADGYTHADVNAALGRPGETVETPVVTSFLQRCLA